MAMNMKLAARDETIVAASMQRREWLVICAAAFTASQDMEDSERQTEFVETLRKLTKQVQG